MTYQNTLQLYFTPASFIANGSSQPVNDESSPIGLTYIADTHEFHAHALTTEKRFFLQIMRAQLQCILQSQTKIRDLLDFVSLNWKKACAIAEEARLLGVCYFTDSMITADEVMTVRSILLLQAKRTKIEVTFEINVQSGEGVAGLEMKVKPSARVVYRDDLKEKKLGDFLEKAGVETNLGGTWVRAVNELEGKLLSRGKK